MLYIIQFILFIAYTISVFFIKSYFILGIVCTINIILMLLLKENFKRAIFSIFKLMPFIAFTAGINMIISGISYGLLIGIRLILVCNMTYIFAKKMTPHKLQYVIETLLKPLKIFKIDSREIGIIVCIGTTFIPIIQREIQEIKYAINAKGYEINLRNVIRKPNYILVPLITMIIKKINDIEASLLSKGYVS